MDLVAVTLLILGMMEDDAWDILVREDRDLVWDIMMGLVMLLTDLNRQLLVRRKDDVEAIVIIIVL